MRRSESVVLEERAVKLLILTLVPFVLVSGLAFPRSILSYAIGIPVLVLWMVSSLIALRPDRLHRDAGR